MNKGLFFILSFLLTTPVMAASLTSLASTELAKVFPGAKIEILGAESLNVEVQSLRYVREDGKGHAYFMINQEPLEYPVSFRAIKEVWTAVARIMPMSPLRTAQLRLQEMDIALGLAHEYRGTLMGKEYSLEKLAAFETRQTILESQFLVQTALNKIPDIRRGEMVRLKIQSSGVELSTTGLAQEPGSVGDIIRVLSNTSKREFTGKLSADKTIEVTL